MSSPVPARSRWSLLSLLLLSALLGWTPAARAFWEYGQVTPDTRFPDGRLPVWELGMIYTPETLYPAEFSVPAGCPVVLHVLNLAEDPATFVLSEPGRRFRVPSGAYRRLDLGRLDPGEHRCRLELPTETHPAGEPVLPRHMRIRVLSGTWPGPAVTFRAAWLATPDGLFPRGLILPAGRDCEVALAGTRDLTGHRWKVGDTVLELKPGALTLTTLNRPRSGTYPAPTELSPGAGLVVR